MDRGAAADFVMNKKGFTLIELLLTIVVISFGMMGVMSLFENASRGALQADLNVIALDLIHEKLERIVVDKVRSGYAALNQTSYPNESFSGDYSVYTRSTTIREVSGSDFFTSEEGSGYKRVDVTVSWGVLASQRLTIPTVLANY